MGRCSSWVQSTSCYGKRAHTCLKKQQGLHDMVLTAAHPCTFCSENRATGGGMRAAFLAVDLQMQRAGRWAREVWGEWGEEDRGTERGDSGG